MNTHGSLVEVLRKSSLHLEYARAYEEATGLPLALRPVDTWQLPLHGTRNENPFCALMASRSRTCAACLQMQEKLVQSARAGASTVQCDYGLSESAVPVRLGPEVVGYLQTGQVFTEVPSEAQFTRFLERLGEAGMALAGQRLRDAYFQTPVISRSRLDSLMSLLTIYAGHLELVGNQIAVQQANAEPPVILRARRFILEHLEEDLSLSQVAGAVHTSTFYFCKLFRKVTGVTFTEFIARARVERAKNLLLNRNLRISEIAYEVGFQSLTHFNRVFKKLAGVSPTHFRSHLPLIHEPP